MLREQIYTAGFGRNPDDGFDEVASHLAAYNLNGEMVAAFRVLGPAVRPFEFEQLHPLDSMVDHGRSPAMIGKLCVHPEYRSVANSTFILHGLLDLAIEFAATRAITDYYIYALPHLVQLYRRASFEELGICTDHVHWGKVSLMRMDVASRVYRDPR